MGYCSMIKLDYLAQLVELSLWSAFIKGERPVSMFLVSHIESGKSSLLKQYKNWSSVSMQTDFNTHIFEQLVPDMERKVTRTLIFPDFLRLVSRSSKTRQNIVTILNSLIEEGWEGKLPFGREIKEPIQANVVTAITPDEISDKRHKWNKMGFLSRFIPVSFSYTDNTSNQIKNYIRDEIYRKDEKYNHFRMPRKSQDIKLPKEIGDELMQLSEIIKNRIDKNLYGFRLQRQIQVITKANALQNNRNIVTENDLEIIQKLTNFMNLDYKQI